MPKKARAGSSAGTGGTGRRGRAGTATTGTRLKTTTLKSPVAPVEVRARSSPDAPVEVRGRSTPVAPVEVRVRSSAAADLAGPVARVPSARPAPPVEKEGEQRPDISSPGDRVVIPVSSPAPPRVTAQDAKPPVRPLPPADPQPHLPRVTVEDAAPPVRPLPPPDAPPQPPLLFEIGWEVCWQLGGIYTVLRSKADCMIDRWDDRYCLIGPYNPATAALEFEERPTEGVLRETLDRLRALGIPCHFGRWLIPGRPRVILLDYRARYRDLDRDKYLMWKDHGISCPAGDGEVNEVVAFGFTVAEFFRQLADVARGRTVVAHFHEWMAGVAIVRIAHTRLPVTTVFTTHATLLGRYLAGDSPRFYQHLPFINPDEQAGKYQIWPKFAIERAAAHGCCVFTTVSEVTAFEAERLLGRRPDVILPNGLNIQRFAALHEFQNLHRQYKEQINEFVMGHFFPSYTFDLNNTLYFYTSGRYEYTNKGIDLFIEALHLLNQRMKTLPAMLPRPTIVAFIITRAATRSINVGVLQNQSMFDELHATCGQIANEMGRRLFSSAATGRIPSFQELLGDDAQVRLKRAIHAWRTRRQPTVITHDLIDDAGDPILRHIRHRGLFNAEDDPVKIVFHPEFVTATSPLINLDYPQFVRGCNLGVFPSYYEPWGYTPMESIAMGVPAVTTDLSGFGAYVQRHVPDAVEQGVLVLNRRTQGFERSADDLANYLFDFVRQNRRQRIEQRNRTERLGERFDWSQLIRHYHEAHDLAMERAGAPRVGRVEVKVV